MNCRINIAGRKVWIDGNNAYGTRPASTEIKLLRDGKAYGNPVTLNTAGDGRYKFPCLIAADNSGKRYVYTIDEDPVPAGYTKTVNGYNITNTLNEITVAGTKTWVDGHNDKGTRPGTVTVNLLRNGAQFRTLNLPDPPAGEDTSQFTFENVPFADGAGKPFAYTIDENAAAGYTKTVNGFNITNTLIAAPFSFNKTSIVSGLSLQGAVFEIRQNGALIATSASDAAGRVYFSGLLPGAYLMAETVSPVGYMDNTDIYDVVVSDDGSVTIDGMPADEFSVRNTPEAVNILLERATAVNPAYMAAPNTWPLRGTIAPALYMLDRILITMPQFYTPITVKWAYGVQDADYFRAGGGIDITAAYQNGVPAPLNTDYTVYAIFAGGIDAVASITVDRVRDGSDEMPYLLIDFSTADALEPSIPGINQFTLFYMQGGGLKLSQNYEIYENIDMSGKQWDPLGTLSAPYIVAEGFTGTLYGNGHDIMDLSIRVQRADDFIGLFRAVSDGARIEDLGIVNSDIEGAYYAAGFAACVNIRSDSAVLKNLRFTGSVTGTTGYTGAIVAYSSVAIGSLNISGCSVDAAIKSSSEVGGIIGICFLQETGTLTVDGCYTAGSTTASLNNVSGIAGNINSKGGSSSITNCVNAMEVNGLSSVAGILGIVLPHTAAVQVKISSCYNKGDITGRTDVAGIAATCGSYAHDSMLFIENCYNSGTITAIGSSNGAVVGGLVAVLYKQNSIKNSYNTGNVFSLFTGTSPYFFFTGGISSYYGIIENCASAGDTVSSLKTGSRIAAILMGTGNLSNNVAFDNMQVLVGGAQKFPLDTGSAGLDGISVTATMLKTQTLYENALGWDFTNFWSFGNGEYTLPILRGIPANLQPDVLPPHLA